MREDALLNRRVATVVGWSALASPDRSRAHNKAQPLH